MYFCMIMNETKRTGYCIFTLIAAVILCIGACSGNKGATDLKGYAIDSIKADTTVYLDKGDGSPKCVLDLNIAYIKKGKHGEMINDTLMRCGILTPDYLSLRSTKLSPEEAVDSFIKRFAGEYKEERQISRSEIIEIGAVIMDESFLVLEEFKTLVKP